MGWLLSPPSPLSLSVSFSSRDPVSLSSRDGPARNRARRSRADRLVSPAIKRSPVRRCHFWQNHFGVPTTTGRGDGRRRDDFVLRRRRFPRFRPRSRPPSYLARRVFTTGLYSIGAFDAVVVDDGSSLDDVDGRLAITRNAISSRLLSRRALAGVVAGRSARDYLICRRWAYFVTF